MALFVFVRFDYSPTCYTLSEMFTRLVFAHRMFDEIWKKWRISHLADFIHHHIFSFSFTPPTVLVRMSVFSKKWFHLTASFPFLAFTLYNFRHLRARVFQVYRLLISFTYSSSLDVPKYRLPNMLLSVSVLESLTIRGCNLPSSLTVDAVKFKSLIQLKLVNIPLNDEVITYLVASCPLLQVLDIDNCSGFKRVCVYGHQNL
ncbi:putative leucine-rich repeat domain superfamily [Helianthus anomalus]